MTENEQIEEMAKIAAKSDDTCRAATIAKGIYNAGYCKVARGEWITPWVKKPYGKAYGTPYCSVCKQMDERKGNFCPFCGADMRGKAEC